MFERPLETAPPAVHLTPLYQYYFRVLIGLYAIAALISYEITFSDTVSTSAGLVSLFLLIYYSANYWVTLQLDKAITGIDVWLAIGDGFVVALAIAELHYTPWPSLLLLGLIQFVSLQQGGIRQWLQANMGVLIGLLFGYFALGNLQYNHQNNLILDISLLVGVFTYICVYSSYTHSYQEKLKEANNKLQKDSDSFRLHAYKLSRYLPTPVTALLKGKDMELKTERKRITVFFSDIVGFTELSEELEAETLTELLNSYFSEMSKIANHFSGTVDKFMGDAVMVLFGDHDSTSKGVKKDAIQCVSMAIEMTKRMRELQPHWAELGIKKPLEIRIGINSGYCTVGTFGTSKNLDYTALGAHVNLASRLESAGKPGNILITHETWSLVKDVILCRDKGHIKAKGFSYPIQVYEVVNYRKDLGANQSYIAENTDGFSMHLDMEKIKNYDKEKVISSLIKAAQKLKEKHIT